MTEGNVVQARRQVDQYARLLWAEMRLTPSDALIARVHRIRRSGDLRLSRLDENSASISESGIFA